MTNRTIKALLYKAFDYPMLLNACIYKRWRAPRDGLVKVHLGQGRRKYLEGWLNVDANFVSARIDVRANTLHGLPVRDNTVDVFYSQHVIEHLPDHALGAHFRGMYRCLKPGGAIRVGGPNGDSAARKLIEGDAGWFNDDPDKHRSVGGRYANFNLRRGEHLTMLTESYLAEIATGAGFVEIRTPRPGAEARFPGLIGEDVLSREDPPNGDLPHTLILEARKPG
jgi:predicted SAM-dependent methyltransferase